jgi:hypothetical protein
MTCRTLSSLVNNVSPFFFEFYGFCMWFKVWTSKLTGPNLLNRSFKVQLKVQQSTWTEPWVQSWVQPKGPLNWTKPDRGIISTDTLLVCTNSTQFCGSATNWGATCFGNPLLIQHQGPASRGQKGIVPPITSKQGQLANNVWECRVTAAKTLGNSICHEFRDIPTHC